MQLLHQTISKLKGFKEWFDTLSLHESQLVLGLSGSVKHWPSHARLRNWTSN